MKTILVTGSAGFIGFHVSRKLLDEGYMVVGLDNMNDYYDVNLKKDRLKILKQYKNYRFTHVDISDKETLKKVFAIFDFSVVINLAAQAGVRYSLKNPYVYIKSNLAGVVNILEECKNHSVKHFIFASSSSVYGLNEKLPFSEKDNTDHPASLYSATKKANELIAHAYSYNYGLPVTGLRFFTVYGPWGRPDMAVYKFTNLIANNKEVKVYNFGHIDRDFTYIDDVVSGVMKIIDKPPVGINDKNLSSQDPSISIARYRIYNIGSSRSINLMKLISMIEDKLDKKANIKYLPMHLGDIKKTHADTAKITEAVDYKPKVTINKGLDYFIKWYKDYTNNKNQ
ncbi:GDP-mannose 4,6-dehydratase [Clostridiaceae bacterium M8S5]|nr:GDP-mannose 4,6-dehydratase [Clostridiaceae bacterium M8S5]